MKQDVFHGQRARRQRANDPEGTKRNIVEIATEEFAGKGFSGARVDDIAARTKTSKRMIYYYFGGKEGLYIAVLEAAYRAIRSVEATLDLEHQEPEQALRTLVSFTCDRVSGCAARVVRKTSSRSLRRLRTYGTITSRIVVPSATAASRLACPAVPMACAKRAPRQPPRTEPPPSS
jgi:AcrR family transcriptional regulator